MLDPVGKDYMSGEKCIFHVAILYFFPKKEWDLKIRDGRIEMYVNTTQRGMDLDQNTVFLSKSSQELQMWKRLIKVKLEILV